MKRALIIAILSTAFAASAQSPRPKPAAPPAAPTPEAPQPAGISASDADAMRADLARMRTLLAQMQRNLAFVDSGLTPLKHQFELEIEMWNLTINDMQRRLNSGTQGASGAAAPAKSTSPSAQNK